MMTAGPYKFAKTCPIRGAHEHVYKGGKWSEMWQVVTIWQWAEMVQLLETTVPV